MGRKRLTGWEAYHRPIYPQKPSYKPIFSKGKREHLIGRIFDAMQDWRYSPFQYEGVTRSHLRSALCLQGYGWGRSDAEAAYLVGEALKGFPRPSYDEGQRSYTIPVENCKNCNGELEDHEIARGIRFCCASCAKAATVWRDDIAAKFAGKIGKQAWYLIRKEDIPRRSCAYCGTVWQPSTYDARYCSQACIERAQPDYIPDRPCKTCGTIFHPQNRRVEFCSAKCRFDYRFPDRDCLECGTSFRPNRDDARFCSKLCSATHYRKNVLTKKQLPERLCRTCSKPFIPGSPKTKYCCSECRIEGSRIILPIQNCVYCGTPFQPANDQAKYCSPKCSQRIKDARQKANRAKLRQPQPCEHCTKLFTPKKAGARFCGESCMKKAAYHRQKAARADASDHPINRIFDDAA